MKLAFAGPSTGCLGRVAVVLACMGAIQIGPASSSADTVHLQGGMTIDAETVELRGDFYHIKSRIGTYDIEKARVIRVEAGVSRGELYELELKKHADTPTGNFEMAQWCDFQKLRSERLKHLKRVIELDSDHAAARKALGYTKGPDGWVRARDPRAPSDEERDARKRAKELESLIRRKVTDWHVKIKAIEKGRLVASRNDAVRSQFADGRRQILAIREPLAIQPLAEVLSRGDVSARLLLVEALARFEQDEATMNLIVLSLLDPDAKVRSAGADALLGRRDDRIEQVVRRALYSEKEWTIRTSASLLGRLGVKSAVPDLVNMLETESYGTVRVSDAVYLDYVIYVYGRPVGYPSGANYLIYQPWCIGVLGPGALVGSVDRYEPAVVSIYRTEVQEALIAITGQNFGFDHEAWMNWWQAHKG